MGGLGAIPAIRALSLNKVKRVFEHILIGIVERTAAVDVRW